MDKPADKEFYQFSMEKQTYFIQAYQRIFHTVLDLLQENHTKFEGLVGKRVTAAGNPTPLSKIGIVLKKLVVNTAISLFTGIEPAYLDNEIPSLQDTPEGRKELYRKMPLKKLTAWVFRDMIENTQDTVEKLDSDDFEVQQAMADKVYRYVKALTPRVILGDNVSFTPGNIQLFLAILFNENPEAFDETGLEIYKRALTLRDRGVNIGLDYNYLTALYRVGEEYERRQG